LALGVLEIINPSGQASRVVWVIQAASIVLFIVWVTRQQVTKEPKARGKPAEVLAFLRSLDSPWCQELAFALVRDRAEQYLRENQKELQESFNSGNSTEKIAYLLLSNITQQEVLSSKYHVYRGLLNSTGQELVRLFGYSLDALVRIGALTAEECAKQKRELVEEIKRWG